MKSNKTKKSRKLPVGITIMLCFLLFSAVLITPLWIFQTVFLDSFYRSVRISQAKSATEDIAEMIESPNDSTDSLRDIISTQSEMSILIYNTTDNFYTQLFPSSGGGSIYFGVSNIQAHEVYRYYRAAAENGGTYSEVADNTGRKRPDDPLDGDTRIPFGDSLEKQFGLEARETKRVVYTRIVNGPNEEEEYFIVVNAMITPVTGMVETLRIQLIIVTWVLVVLSLVLAIIMSRIISRPIVKVNKNAKELAKQNYAVEFSGGAYREIQELNETLNYAVAELSKVDNLRQELIANVSHDLRTPLTMIIGYGEVIRDLPGENTPENIQIIIDEATHLSTLVNDLMDLSKLQSGAMKLEPEVFSLTESVKNIFMRYSKLVGRGFKIRFESNGDASVNADEIKITQVLYNLINNAVNYAGEDKTVTVRQKAADGQVTIEVEDHGQGIEPDKLEFIWDRYYKVDKSHKSSVIGTGLGLSIVKNILDLHGARYGVKSRLGSGSVFWFSLPCTKFVSGEKSTLYLNAEGYGAACEDSADFSENGEAL